MNQFNQSVAEDHLASRCREILADREGIRFDHLNILGLGVTHEVAHTFGQALALGADEALHRYRIEPEEIARRHHVQPLA